jgi:hypothetical protein
MVPRRDVIRATGAATLGVSSLMLPAAAQAASTGLDVAGDFDVEEFDVGDEAYGGYFAGVIDTRGKQSAVADYAFPSQGGVSYDQGFEASPVGRRYAIFVSPISHTPTAATRPAWRTNDGVGFTPGITRWDGRSSTQHVIDNLNLAHYPLFRFARNVNTNAFLTNGTADGVTLSGGSIATGAPDDGGSPWYIPAMDELEVLYRAFKPTSDDNFVSADDPRGAVSFWRFPGTQQLHGKNPSVATATSSYTVTVPPQTSLAAFRSGGAQVFGSGTTFRLWSSTIDGIVAVTAWHQNFGTTDPGRQGVFGTPQALQGVRLIRRVEF